MYELTERLQPFLLIGVGAIFGSWARIYATKYIESRFSFKYIGTFVVNTFAAFFLGFFVAIQMRSGMDYLNSNSPLFMFFCVGFLGSLSTFSTFMTDLMNTLLDKKITLCTSLAFFSILAGLFSVALGLTLGNA